MGRRPPSATVAIYVFTLLTGATGLVYQVVWQRYLVRLLGGDGPATATVLGVFLAGLSLGYLICGRLSVGTRSPWRLYGLLEGVVGLWAGSFPWIFAAVTRATAGWSFEAPVALVWQGAVAAAVLMGPPTICMGGTVPILTRALAASRESATGVHARVYAFNTGGAVAGTLLAGFVLIERFGLPLTLRGAAAINLLAAGFFLALARRDPARARAVAAAPRPPLAGAVRWYALALLVGFASMTFESLLIRATGLSLGSSSYSFSLVVAAFVLCIALGAFVVAALRRIGPAALAWNQALAVVGMAIVFVGLDVWPYRAHLLRIDHPERGEYYLAAFVRLVALLAMPVGAIGATLPLLFDRLRGSLREVGRLSGTIFAWNALGSLLGGLLGGYLLLRWLGIGELFVTALIVTAATAVLAARGGGRRALAAAAVSVTVAVGVGAWFPFDPLRMGVGTFRLREELDFSRSGADVFYGEFYKTRTVLAYRDDPSGTFAVVENLRPAEALVQRFPSLVRWIGDDRAFLPGGEPRPRSILVNGKSDSSTYYDRETLKLSAHLGALLAPRCRNVLVVGLGTGVTAGELTLYPEIERIDVAEIAPAVVDFLRFFDGWNHLARQQERIRIHRGDAFRLVGRGDREWDVITSEPSNPWVTGVDQLFSRDFYRLVREHLADDGLFVQWVQRYATTEEIFAIVINTLRSEFDHVRVFRSGHDELLVASKRPLTDEAFARAARRLEANRAVRDSLAEIGVASVDDLRERERPAVLALSDRLARTGIETLDHPRLHYLSGRAFFAGVALDEEAIR